MDKVTLFLLILFIGVVTMLSACQSEDLDKDELVIQYYDFIQSAQQLFGNHRFDGDEYYNHDITTIHDAKDVIGDMVTDEGLRYTVNRFYKEKDGKLVYHEKYQQFIEETELFRATPDNPSSYYQALRNTILNPGLQFLKVDDFLISEHEGKIILEALEVPISFYHSDDDNRYEQFGYPARDVLSVHFTFVKKQGIYLLEKFSVGG
ncbi:hypothetical protein [Bacillus alkalicellulosilyticus]|uniref:hypothetical protein n=1 Tax=Alkalihalobacterium alkalicellulosilyticum TaxID=1912214 RepID=UPI001116226F|nr:hypothetical protein [Bacillus alkalicellulosilyticus]